MGSIIGKAGIKIKDIQETSGARINASEEMLPNSTERAITISGVPDSIHIAVYHIGAILMENFDRNDRSVIFYKPLPKYYQSDRGGYTAQAQAPPLPAPLSATFNRRSSHLQSPGTPHDIPNDQEVQQIYIPNDMVGCIIGKAGSRINEIRLQTSCSVKIAEEGNGQGERLVTIQGSAEGCQLALYLLYQRYC